MKYLFLLILLCGCSTSVPVTRSFPDVPEEMMVKCLPLIPLQEDAKLSDIGKNVTYNYSLYHECFVKAEAWQEWYSSQKKIFEEVK